MIRCPNSRWKSRRKEFSHRLYSSKDASYRISARTSFGKISSELPINVSGILGNDSLEGTIGGGACELRLNDSNGGIEILKSGKR